MGGLLQDSTDKDSSTFSFGRRSRSPSHAHETAGARSSSAGRSVAGITGLTKRPHSAQPDSSEDRPRFSIGNRGAFAWREGSIFADSKPRLSTRRTQEAEGDDEAESVFSYRAALGGFGVKPDSEQAATQDASAIAEENDVFDMADAVSDAGSVFSEQEGRRRSRAHQEAQYKALLPGYEERGNKREKAHLRRIVTSADNLFPARHSLKMLGIESINGLVYDESDPTKLMSHLSADIHSGLWSCCRKTKTNAPGCTTGTHSTTKFLCTRCGVLFDTASRKVSQHECYYHPGAINRSKAGGVWWTCCGAVGFKNSVLHSSGGDLHGAQDFKWGCKKDKQHVPLSTFDIKTNHQKYLQCTYDAIEKQDAVGPTREAPLFFEDTQWIGTGEKVTCTRITAMTCVAQPLLPVILGIQLQYEIVTKSDFIDGDRFVGNPGPVSDRDHLRKIREERLVFEDGEYIIEIQMQYSDRFVQTLTVITSIGRQYTFFEQWKIDSDEKSLQEMQAGEDVRSLP